VNNTASENMQVGRRGEDDCFSALSHNNNNNNNNNNNKEYN